MVMNFNREKNKRSLNKGEPKIIKTVIRCPNDMVMVFDKKGEQIPEYQGQYEEVKGKILKDAPPDAVFSHGFQDDFELKVVPREE